MFILETCSGCQEELEINSVREESEEAGREGDRGASGCSETSTELEIELGAKRQRRKEIEIETEKYNII